MILNNTKLSIYLDMCCYNRPFDVQNQDKIRIEADAVLSIIGRGELGQWDISTRAYLY